MTDPITAGTSVEAILRDMLEKYNLTTITFSSLKSAFQNIDGSYPALTNRSSLGIVEVGRGLRSAGFSFSIGDTSQTEDNSVRISVGGSTLVSGISETGSPATFATDTQDVSSPTSRTYTVAATDSGGSSDQTIDASKTVYWRYLVKLLASSTETITSGNAETVYDGATEMGTNLNSGTSWSVRTTSAGNLGTNYTYIVFPASFGDLQNVIQDGALSVINAFTDLGDFTINNQYGVSVSYSFYRTNSKGAFEDDTLLDITF